MYFELHIASCCVLGLKEMSEVKGKNILLIYSYMSRSYFTLNQNLFINYFLIKVFFDRPFIKLYIFFCIK